MIKQISLEEMTNSMEVIPTEIKPLSSFVAGNCLPAFPNIHPENIRMQIKCKQVHIIFLFFA